MTYIAPCSRCIRRLVVGLLFAGAFFTAAGSQVRRDWRRFPAVSETDVNEDIYVVGDVHGDYKRLVRVLTAAAVIGNAEDPKHVSWKAGNAMVVFLGDLIDKGQHSVDVIDFVQALRKAAGEKGGQVFTLMGNHEAEFLADPSSRKVKDFSRELKAQKLSPADVAACRTEVGEFLCAEPFALRIRSWFFSHGGNTHARSMATLIEKLQAGVDADGFGTEELIGDNSILEARLNKKGPNGRPWFESGPNRDAQTLLQSYVDALGVKHLVQGHQSGNVTFADGVRRKKGQMFQRYGLLFLADTGMSKAIDDSDGAVLRIKAGANEEAVAICPDGTEKSIWDSKTMPDLGLVKACGK
jgi:hypothetical protein